MTLNNFFIATTQSRQQQLPLNIALNILIKCKILILNWRKNYFLAYEYLFDEVWTKFLRWRKTRAGFRGWKINFLCIISLQSFKCERTSNQSTSSKASSNLDSFSCFYSYWMFRNRYARWYNLLLLVIYLVAYFVIFVELIPWWAAKRYKHL